MRGRSTPVGPRSSTLHVAANSGADSLVAVARMAAANWFCSD